MSVVSCMGAFLGGLEFLDDLLDAVGASGLRSG